MAETELDSTRMCQAMGLARESFGVSDPNPRVGCIIGHQDGRILGIGATQQVGKAHAEVVALRSVAASGQNALGATAWVTLEPCAHFGRTPPCCDALIAAGLSRCFVALQDPDERVAGNGIARMRAAGIQVELATSAAIIDAAREINIGFFSRIERGRPWVRVKSAASADGRVALADGRSKWITGKEARADGHAWRRRASAVMTGIGTVLADDPRLDVREVTTVVQPIRIILDRRLRLPLDAAILRPPGKVLVITDSPQVDMSVRLRALGVEVWDDWEQGAIPSFPALFRRLGQSGLNEVHVEAGPTLTGALLEAGVVDELLLYLAPALIGPGLSIASLAAAPGLPAQIQGRWLEPHFCGRDLRLRMLL